MKTAEGFVSKWSNWWITNNNKNVLNRAFENELKEIIKQARKEAYNQAIDDVLDPYKIDYHYDENTGWYVKKKSILKLKK